MTTPDLPTLRAACESALSRAEGKTSQPVVMLPAGMVLGLVEENERLKAVLLVARAHLVAGTYSEAARDIVEAALGESDGEPGW